MPVDLLLRLPRQLPAAGAEAVGAHAAALYLPECLLLQIFHGLANFRFTVNSLPPMVVVFRRLPDFAPGVGMLALEFGEDFAGAQIAERMLPVIGVPLPLISFGGTALVSLFIGLGILMSVQANRKLVKT